MANKICKKCKCVPCRCEQIAIARKIGATHCDSCGVKLIDRGGYAGTDLCGPCCTGEADTIDEV
jgi:hypothetical protein